MKTLMAPYSYEMQRYFAHYPCFSDTHILPDGHFPIDLAHLPKKKNHYYMIALKRLCIMALSYIWEILTVPKMPILDQPNVIAKVTHGNKCQPRKL